MSKNERTTPIDLFILLSQKKKYYFVNFVLVGLLSTVIAMFLPKWFQAETKILPPSKDLGFLGGFSQIFSNLPMTRALGIKGMSEEEGICISILNSRTLSEAIINKHNLTLQYKKTDIEKTMKVFQERLKYFNDEEGSIVIRFTDNNPIRSAEITNDIVKILDSLYVSLNLDRTSRNRLVVEKRLFQNRVDMERVETELANFQKKYNIVSLEEQTKATVEVMSQLQAKIISMQFELGLKERLLGEYNSEVKALNEQIFSIQNELEKLRSGENNLKNEIIVKNKQNKKLFIPLKDIPDIGQKYLDLYKEVQIQNKLYIFLVQQVEQLKIQELMSTSSIQIIDRAQPPLHKVKPKRLLIILSSILSSSLLLTFLFILENNLNLMNYTNHEKYLKIIKLLHFWK